MRAQAVGAVDYNAILERDGRICHICGLAISHRKGELHFDHVVPISRGGAHSMENIRPAHRQCNLIKGASSGADPVTVSPAK